VDRIEVLSPGGLPVEVSAEAFLAGRATAHWRNQGLSWFFNRLDLAQSEGQGIPTILRVMAEAGYSAPDFEVTDHQLQVVLRAHPAATSTSLFDELDHHLLLWREKEFVAAMVAMLKSQPADPTTLSVLLDGIETFGSSDQAPLPWGVAAIRGTASAAIADKCRATASWKLPSSSPPHPNRIGSGG
jgi:hypothetical protein